MGKGSGQCQRQPMEIAGAPYFKYPRTVHLPWSEGRDDDDIALDTVECFAGKEIVVTEKLDGENTTLYRDHYHARSLDSKYHPSRTFVQQIHGRIQHEIPHGWRICGENLYAKHSIAYDSLPAYFVVFSVWDESNRALSWEETKEWASLLELKTAPLLYQGTWDEEAVRACYPCPQFSHESEGYVVRLTESFAYEDFSRSVAKFVRYNHIKTDQHWLRQQLIPNQLSTE